jgi:hypothetical protein
VGFELIFGPLVVLSGMLVGFALGVDTVNILQPVTATAAMEQRGLSSEVATRNLVTNIAQVADFDTEFHEVGAKDIAGDGFVESVARALSIDETVLAARRLPGAIAAEFQPEFIERDSGTVLRLRITRPATGVHLVEEFTVEGDAFEPVFRKASRAILVVIDPVTLAMDDLWQGDLVSAGQSIERALRATAGQQRQVAETLLGIRQLAEGDAVTAERTLRAAIWRRTDFAPAHLALARALAQTRGPDAARAVLEDLDLHAAGGTWSERAAREVPAAAAYVRARLAAAEGDWPEAVALLHQATTAVPTFAAAHEALVEAYLAQREAPFAEYHAQTALRLTAPDVPRFDDQLDHMLQLAVTPIRPRPGS